MRKITFVVFILTSPVVFAQPYLDIAKFQYAYSSASGLNKKTSPVRYDLVDININFPLELKKGGDAFIINPFFNNDQGMIASKKFHVISEGLLLGFFKKDILKQWNLTTAFVLRQNKEVEKKLKEAWQYGGLVLATYKKTDSLSLKFGIYYNREFFGNFFMPLVGIDWRMNWKNNLFGVLPGSMVFEHKVNQRFYYGASFRALTNSYREQTIDPCFSGDCSARNYLRIDDNQLGVFADVYLSKKIVVNAETGYTILRRYRFGYKGEIIHEQADYKSDNFYLKLALLYRMRFN